MGDWAFQYDTLNRLTGMAPAGNAPAAYVNLIGCYGYDDTGNRSLAGLTSSDCSGSNPPTATYNSSNRVTSGGYIYDSDGNVYYDGTNYYAYDAEDRLCAVETFLNGGPSTWWQYIYDAEGLRVAKATFTGSFPAKNTTCAAPGTETTFTLKNQYLLDQGGNQVTEMDGSGTWMHSNVWAGAHLEATYDLDPSTNAPALHFHLGDPLGTRRVQTNVLGQVEETCQSLPFGDGLNCVQPAGAPATADDATTHHFTSKERDTESGGGSQWSGNDYFGARYYSSTMGRFMSPDWSAKVEPVPYSKMGNPQSLNLYAYVGNSPLGAVDMDGHDGNARQGVVDDPNQGNMDQSWLSDNAPAVAAANTEAEFAFSGGAGFATEADKKAAQQQSVQQQQQYLNGVASGLRLVPTEDYSPGDGVADRSVGYKIQNADGTPYVSGGKTGNPDLFVNEIITGGQPGGTTPVGNGQYSSASPPTEKNQWNDSLGNKLATSTVDYKQSFIVSGASGVHPAISAPLMVRYGGNDYGTLGVHIGGNGVVLINGLTKFPGTP